MSTIVIESIRYFGSDLKTRAYALARRSSLARSIVARFRRIRHRAVGSSSDFIAAELTALLEFLRRSGCTFHNCTALGNDPRPLGISFRYDVHVRDIAACHAFIETHRAQHIPATFFPLWDYSQLEHDYIVEFRELAANIVKPLEIGLHDSPVDAYLIQTRFRGDRGACSAWLNRGAVEWIACLAGDEGRLAEFNSAVLTSFVTRVRRTQELFGPISTVACHGGDLLHALRDRLDRLDPGVAQVARSLFARSWLTPERVTAAGIEASVDGFGGSGAKWRQVSDGGGTICRMMQRIQNCLDRKLALQILLHPFTWDGAKRDGELSHLLRGGSEMIIG
jgi:hypothetical protein